LIVLYFIGLTISEGLIKEDAPEKETTVPSAILDPPPTN